MTEIERAVQKYGVFDYVPMGMFVLRKDFTVLFWNKCIENLTGISRDGIVDTNICDHFPNLKTPEYLDRLSAVFNGGPPAIFSSQLHKHIIPLTLPDEQPQIQCITVISMPAMNKNDFYALFSIRDVTELTRGIQDYRAMCDQVAEEIETRKKVEKELKKAYEQAEGWVMERTFELVESNKSLQCESKERELAEKELMKAHTENKQLLEAISSILIGVNEEGLVTRWNRAAEETFDIPASAMEGRPFSESGIQWVWKHIIEKMEECRLENHTVRLDSFRFTRPNGQEGFLGITLNPIIGDNDEQLGLLILGRDITERVFLENQLAQAQKLESIGLLAAGIAHEINTPTQYVSDNTRFLQEGFHDIIKTLQKYDQLLAAVKKGNVNPDLVTEVGITIEKADIEYLKNEIPQAIEQSLEGVERITKIVRAMKEFSHPAEEEKTAIDINKAIESTITIARNEWKYVADMETDFDELMPLVLCLPGELNQVILNIIVNAAHAISNVVEKKPGEKGKITVATKKDGDWAEIRISDTGSGIPDEIREKVFDPFFTTKGIDKGTGQGLTISHNIVVEKHSGTIAFETEMGKGTTFVIRLPISDTDDNEMSS